MKVSYVFPLIFRIPWASAFATGSVATQDATPLLLSLFGLQWWLLVFLALPRFYVSFQKSIVVISNNR